ncbi:MAG TPA: FAD-dependent oxidoreductase [Dehalococcoidia bacterium]|nr:FAD-dependent oxidoreductase [Dehalococcoidia bacterium]
MDTNTLILGAGFGGLELASRLSDAFGPDAGVTLIDQNEGFVFGFSKFELMFGRATLDEVMHRYAELVKPGVAFRRERILSIDPAARRVVTDRETYEAQTLVVALGAEYDPGATPGFVEGGHEFYSVPGAIALHDVLLGFEGGAVVIGVLGQPFKCPPAPCEAAMLLEEWLTKRGQRERSSVTLVHPWGTPVPPSPDGSVAIRQRFEERGITFLGDRTITHIDPAAKTVHIADGSTVPYDLFLGIPIHRVPAVVVESGLAEDGWIPVDKTNLATRFPGVYALGDVTSAPVPKAGVFAESAARALASYLIDQAKQTADFRPFDGSGSCYVEFGGGLVGRVDADFLTGPQPRGPFVAPSEELAREKAGFATTRDRRWFRA